MRKALTAIIVCMVLSIALASTFHATALAVQETWNDVVDEMEAVLNQSYEIYLTGDVDAAKAQVDVAYFGYYEKLGFEKTVMSYISGNRAATVEYQFSFIKKAMTAQSPNAEVQASLATLITLLREDANQLDGTEESAWGILLASLLIITREGFEAIIIVGAIVAYLHKSGNKAQTAGVYGGTVIALLASVLMAIVLNLLSGLSGANQEIIEGVTMLVAVVVLFYVSNWMVGKAEAEAWSRFIDGKIQRSLTKGSLFSLAFAAFLSVFREGAETILFYQALLASTRTHVSMIWLGLGIGVVALVFIYYAIHVLSIRVPLKPFFLGTSLLLAVMAISFLGTGIKELQEGNVISVTSVAGISSVDLLGIYPTWETLLPQLALLILTVATFVIQMMKGKKTETHKLGTT